MNSMNTKSFLFGSLALIIGLIGGFIGHDLVNKKDRSGQSAIVSVHKMQDANNNLLSSNESIAPGVWHIYLDPFWTPTSFPFPLLPVPPLVQFSSADVPKVQTIQSDQDIRVIVQLPGLTEKDVDVQVGKDALAIKGQKLEEYRDRNDRNKEVKTIQESFQEVINLPCQVTADKAKATIKNGMLTISLPKASNSFAQRQGRTWQ